MTAQTKLEIRENHLDGLRGWAAVFVLISHLRPFLQDGLHIPRLFFADGMLAVSIFFVLSGYVLSINFYSNNSKSNIIDLAMRRYPRLAIPVFASCMLTYLLLKTNAFYNLEASKITKNTEWLPAFFQFSASLPDVFRYSLYEIFTNHLATPSFNPVLWTMSYELAGSFIVLGILLAGGKNKHLQMVLPIAFLIASTICNSHLSGFAYGMLISLFTARSERRNLDSKVSKTLMTCALLTTLYITSKRPTSDDELLLPVCAAICVFCINFTKSLQKAFSNKLSVWLGSLSFPIYLTHIPVLFSATSWFIVKSDRLAFPTWTTNTITILLSISLSILAAIAFRPIETMSIRYSKTLSKSIISMYYSAQMKIIKPS